MAFWCAGRTPSLPGAGETSSMNAMVWVRGSRRNYDGQAMPGWGSYMTRSSAPTPWLARALCDGHRNVVFPPVMSVPTCKC